MPQQKDNTKTRVLIMEDEMDMRFYLMTMVKSLGHEPVLAQNGIQGLDMLAKERVDLIILDVMMPEKGGGLVYKELKTHAVYKNIPLIVFSGVNQDAFSHYVKMLNTDPDLNIPEPKYYVEKSADPDYLREVINMCIC
ncbi:MAG: response regulator [Desulfotignum sp.]|nr:response regulator [Desulfotignum sp.]MCF8112243.1 response regulator [Desulfotignum sp.]